MKKVDVENERADVALAREENFRETFYDCIRECRLQREYIIAQFLQNDEVDEECRYRANERRL